MALIWNTSVLLKTPLSNMSWPSLSTNRANWNTPWPSRSIFYWEGQVLWVSDKSSVPQWYISPYTWILAPKTWWLGAGFSISWTWSISSGNLAWWKNAEATLAGAWDITNAGLGLILSAVATISGIGWLSADVRWALQASATLAGQGDISWALWALAWAVASITWSASMNGSITAKWNMSADIYINQSQASVVQIVDWVWNALASEYNASGTMWEAAQTGGGGGGWYTPAQIADAVWDEPLTWATHNVPTSAGRRLRQLASIAIHEGTAQGSGTWDNQIQLDTWASSTNGAYDPSEIAIVWGTGAGQSRLIIQYVWATKMATVDRNWRVNPDATSEFIIYVNSGREHVNEGLAQWWTPSTITLNANASSADGAYIGQTVFLRSWTWEDQVARVTAYNWTTKVATISTSMQWNTWSVTPDTTTWYVMIPNYHIEGTGWWGGGGWLTTEEHTHLMKLRNGGGGALINYESIEKWLAKDRKWLYEKIEAIPGLITDSEERITTAIWLVNTSVSTIIENNGMEILSESVEKLAESAWQATKLAKEVATEGKRKTEKLSHTIETYRLEDEIKEETKDLTEKHEKKIQDEVKALETEIQIQDEVKNLALEAQIQDEVKSLESNL